MRRYWIPKECVQGDEVVLTGDVLHHIRDVCRQDRGSKFEVIAEGGTAFLVEVSEMGRKQGVARILESRQIQPLPLPHIELALSIPRFPVFEAVVEKAVELGVHRIHPFFSEFSFIRTQSDVIDKKRTRWQKIIQGATQQSGRGDLMEITEARPLADLLLDFNRETQNEGLFLYEGEGVLAVKEALAQLQKQEPQRVWLFIGSEGGFSDREVQHFQSLGLQPVTLGGQVLRVETACVAAVSVIKYDFDQMR